MSSKSQPPKDSGKNDGKGSSQEAGTDKSRLPFEPTQNKRKTPKKPVQASAASSKEKPDKPEKKANSVSQRGFTGVPEIVSKRMARRMAFFCGVPTGMGMLTFVVSYFIVSQHIYKLPTVVVLLTSLGFFGLGVLGLSYGALSASWDEDRTGSWFGWSEFRTNFGRAVESWKNARQKAL
ncbi:UDP-N-acetylmuramyl pentapeptide phosphotransferase/UDP-N-acetylglucosamine-1-phosphate transferase [Leptolyngbyaceae cyanobacterium JSC-12]|nr:UDP-N-acetylmuramyl pentapeptide phosphotransferase/UDP-N-acetylglucosamine-1-phosphate transferase [Leptolyngbyaceae cyanobacterium JSC-12]